MKGQSVATTKKGKKAKNNYNSTLPIFLLTFSAFSADVLFGESVSLRPQQNCDDASTKTYHYATVKFTEK